MKKAAQKGFTIVELLVVIVVIGILAAITMVSYSGVTTKAKSTAAQSNAASVRSVIETYYADNGTNAGNGTWPTTAASVNTYSATSTALAKLPGGITLSGGTEALTTANGTTTITYMGTSTGGCIAYFNFGTSTLNFYYVGAATTATESATTAGTIDTCS